jgi:S-adenosylmethionine:tRNA ribosyltransferase-isomerase
MVIPPATMPRPVRDHRMLVVDAVSEEMRVEAAAALPDVLARGDIVVVNDAGTLPASLRGVTDRGQPVELRIASVLGERRLRVAVFGEGDHRIPTEHRPDAPAFTHVRLGSLIAVRCGVSEGRLVEVELSETGAPLWSEIHRIGRPVQYAHVPAPLELWDVQNVFAGRPWAVEMPSASRFFRVETVLALRRRGIDVVAVTHAAGLSSIGTAEDDARLPLPERYEVRTETWEAIAQARSHGGRVVAIGTSTVRALEGAARAGRQTGVTDLRIGKGFRCAVADAVLTGIHEPGTSHHELLKAFASPLVLERALERAAREGFLGHELGDACLVFGARATRANDPAMDRSCGSSTRPTSMSTARSAGSSDTKVRRSNGSAGRRGARSRTWSQCASRSAPTS